MPVSIGELLAPDVLARVLGMPLRVRGARPGDLGLECLVGHAHLALQVLEPWPIADARLHGRVLEDEPPHEVRARDGQLRADGPTERVAHDRVGRSSHALDRRRQVVGEVADCYPRTDRRAVPVPAQVDGDDPPARPRERRSDAPPGPMPPGHPVNEDDGASLARAARSGLGPRVGGEGNHRPIVVIPAIIGAMAELRQRDRAKLPDSAFAYIDSSGRRRLPINDEPHVRNALARFNRILFEDEAARDRARTRLLKAAKRHGILPVGFIDGQLRPKLPSGQLTLLFADIEGSSKHLAELGDRYGPMLSAVRRIERAAVRGHSGHEVDARADELFAVFKHPAAAFEAAVEMQRGFASHAWPDRREVRVRIGLHTGRPTVTATGYQGISVNTAARLCQCGHGGQTLVSRATHAALADEAPQELRLLGSYRLRGIPDDHEIFQAVIPDLPDDFPPLRIEEASVGEYRLPH